MLPLGGPEGHKGYGLSFAVETLAALLPGLGFGIDPAGRHNDGTFMLAVDPKVFYPSGNFQEMIEGFVKFLKETPPMEGVSEVYYPGELEYRTEQRRRAEGVPIEDSTWARLNEVATRFGLSDKLSAMS
jgi:uncharacterized oxidoreductase